jgi:hypothetical protein
MSTWRMCGMALALTFLSGCGLPTLSMFADSSVPIAPSGPSVAALIANIKCELWEAANDTTQLPYYDEVPSLPPHVPKDGSLEDDPERNFTLRNLFEEIEFIAELKLTLDVTDSGAVNPSANFIKPYAAAGTNVVLAVGGQAYDSAHRNIDIFQSVDFSRLVESPRHRLYVKGFSVGPYKFNKFPHEPGPAKSPYVVYGPGTPPCDHGIGLHGNLGLKEVLATGAIAARMQDVAVLATPPGASGSTVFNQPPPSGFNGYAFGQVNTQIDFTINLDINAGPNWTLLKFKGPNVTGGGGANGQGLLNFSRQDKDTVVLTFMPVCIRQKYFPKAWLNLSVQKLKFPASTSYSGSLNGTIKDGEIKAGFTAVEPPGDTSKPPQLPAISYPADYDPPMSYGTPIWANQLPPCLSSEGEAARQAAPAAARMNLQLNSIDNALRQQQQELQQLQNR